MSIRYRPGILQDRLESIQKAILRAEDKALDTTARAARQKLDAVVATWTNQPAFEIMTLNTAVMKRRNVMIQGTAKAVAIFGYVDRGTEPHEIRPKKAKFLAFAGGGYKPKTQFQAKFGGAGKASGATVFAQVVHHPGNEARDFSGAYREDAMLQLRKELHRELDQAL